MNKNLMAEFGNSIKVIVKGETESLVVGKFIKFSKNNSGEDVVVLLGLIKGKTKDCKLHVIPFKNIKEFNRTRLVGDLKKFIDLKFSKFLETNNEYSSSSENTYWNNKGRFQKRVDELNKLAPNIGRETDNKYLNVFLILSKYYYDVYNNGGCNLLSFPGEYNGLLDNGYEIDELEEINDEGIIKSINFNVNSKTLYRYLMDKDKLENLMNEFIYNTKDKDFKATLYKVYYNSNKELVSKNKKDGEGWSEVSFATSGAMIEWYNHRIRVFNCKEVE